MTTDVTRQGNMGSAMAWMVGLSAVLAWMPLLGGLIAGFVGGQKAGTPGRALAAAILPGVIFGLLMFFMGPVLGSLPLIGGIFRMFAGLGGAILSTIHVIPLVIGALIGGALAKN